MVIRKFKCNSSIGKNQNQIAWNALSGNPAIFNYDYKQMRDNYKELKEELIQKAWHPSRISVMLENGRHG
jgi:hypothetical protein